MNDTTIRYDDMPSPVGVLRLSADVQGLCGIRFPGRHGHGTVPAGWLHDPRALAFARTALQEYFDGARTAFALPLHPHGTPFQLAVWHELARIPYGETISYGELARRVGDPGAARAVGAANGANPLPIVVPCHRVIGANGSLTGFGGGLPTKRWLLGLEARVARGDLFGH
ncbi:MAG TPA: methylated-DNA--[protein]-cysteine S-methyltransferase [Dyella sp.]|nr:methylated-DNA--[protein]-cysteine S-methyltransferase [Dyella sp.]